ncbi:MAG: hypothetical protein IJ566_05105 [Cardiobacteriaceae bacterium]|nr:hypothetical protein [Cardiobacteriaceae bacterium]
MASKVFIVNNKFDADYKVFFVQNKFDEKAAEIITGGTLVKNKFDADVKVFIVNNKYDADILIMHSNFPKGK